MPDVIHIERLNAVHDRILAERGIAAELRDHFTFAVPNARWDPRVKSGIWDGQIRLYSFRDQTLYCGLREKVEEFARARDYEVILAPNIPMDAEFSLNEAAAELRAMNLPMLPRDYQGWTFVQGVRKRRALIVSPTASGKSFIIHLLLAHYDKPSLIIVPTINLVTQMATNLVEYGWDARDITTERNALAQVHVHTWQALQNLPESWFSGFDVVVGDEAHGFKANELKGIMERMKSTEHRFGLTGTLDGTATHQMVLEGLFGPIIRSTTTRELIRRGTLAQLEVKVIVLGHSDEDRKALAKSKTYASEVSFLTSCEPRNRFLRNLATSLDGNTILLFHFVERHGKPLHAELKRMNGRPVYFVSGEVEAEVREEIRRIVDRETDALIVASDGTFAQGVDIPSLRNIILAAPGKGRIRLLQSIGRVLRQHDGKDGCTVFDIADDLSWRKRQNHTLRHLNERVRIYNQEGFKYTTYRVALRQRGIIS